MIQKRHAPVGAALIYYAFTHVGAVLVKPTVSRGSFCRLVVPIIDTPL